MQRETSRVVTFDFTFQYPRFGIQEVANAVTVCEPNYDKRHVYIAMKGYMGEVQNGLMKLYSDPGIASMVAAARERQGSGAQDQPETAESDDDGPTLLDQMQRVLGVDGYAKVYDYLQKQLTDAASLAYVGSETGLLIRDRTPITPPVWEAIAREGGMAAIDRILGAFTDFFLNGPQPSSSTKAVAMSGSTSPQNPPASPTAGSRSKKRSDTPSQD